MGFVSLTTSVAATIPGPVLSLLVTITIRAHHGRHGRVSPVTLTVELLFLLPTPVDSNDFPGALVHVSVVALAVRISIDIEHLVGKLLRLDDLEFKEVE